MSGRMDDYCPTEVGVPSFNQSSCSTQDVSGNNVTTKTLDVLDIAGNLFFKQGYANTTVTDLVRETGIPESTFRRRFVDGKVGVYWALLARAAEFVHDEYVSEIRRARLSETLSDPKELVLIYVKTIIGLWHSDANPKWPLSLLFGADFGYEIEADEKHSVKNGGDKDIELLDHIILRGCEGQNALAKGASCIVLGALREYIEAQIHAPYGYDRQYESEIVVSLLESLLSSIFADRALSRERLQARGLSAEKLMRLNSELKECAITVEAILDEISKSP